MIQRDGKWQQFVCDDCGNETDEFDDFNELLTEARNTNWKIAASVDGWTHFCPDCHGLAAQQKLFS